MNDHQSKLDLSIFHFNNDASNKRTKILLTVILSSIIVLSLLFNGLTLYAFGKSKKKISADYIKAQLFSINIVFTVVAIPYYIVKETGFFLGNDIICKLLYFFTDFIMFVYNNLLILMAFDRFIFICTNIRFKLSNFMKIFHFISILVALPSVSRLLSNNCNNTGFDLWLDNIHNNKLIILYNFFIILSISINWMITIILYSILIRYVYMKSIRSSYGPFQCKFKSSCSKEADEKLSNELNQSNLLMEVKESKFSKSLAYNRNLINSKHWRITKIFIKVFSGGIYRVKFLNLIF